MSVDVLIGRSLALCLHPMLAWRFLSPVSRGVLITFYFVLGYLGGLVILLFM
jgi:hypothetical protein